MIDGDFLLRRDRCRGLGEHPRDARMFLVSQAGFGHEQAVKVLLDAGADVLMTSTTGLSVIEAGDSERTSAHQSPGVRAIRP